MDKFAKKQLVANSLIDYLIDDTSAQVHSLSALCLSVRRNLENLLNTRKYCLGWLESWNELKSSLLNYGIIDFMSKPLDSEALQQIFCRDLSVTIQHYEPRLNSVEVKLLRNHSQHDRNLYLRIQGVIYAEPIPEPIILNSILNPENGRLSFE